MNEQEPEIEPIDPEVPVGNEEEVVEDVQPQPEIQDTVQETINAFTRIAEGKSELESKYAGAIITLKNEDGSINVTITTPVNTYNGTISITSNGNFTATYLPGVEIASGGNILGAAVMSVDLLH